ncbi:MAG: thioredoxin family protein [Bacteroidales bacterium]|nr:thioredoxin family protein [Bacteroidales bacterium]
MNKKLFTSGLFVFALGLLMQLPATAQEKKVNWLSIEEAQELHKKNPKKIFVDIYTDWCSWCKRMDAETFTHPVIVDYINENFYAVKLNAEQTDPIVFKGVTYENERAKEGQRRAAHNFAIAILQGRMSYPSVAFFDENLSLIYAIPGFRPPARMEPVLVFFSEDVYKSNPNLDEFTASFQGKVTQ